MISLMTKELHIHRVCEVELILRFIQYFIDQYDIHFLGNNYTYDKYLLRICKRRLMSVAGLRDVCIPNFT